MPMFTPTKLKLKYFWGVAVVFHITQYFLIKAHFPSYIATSLDVLVRIFGRSSVFLPGQEWFSFPYLWAYALIFAFWIAVWYAAACLLARFFKSN